MNFETISVIGLGYIGLPTAAVLASRKKRVIGVDVNQNTVNTINQGDIHIVEPELDIIVRAAVSENYLRATISPEPADAFLIAVPTPFKDDHKPDLSFIRSAVKSIAPVLAKGNLVILESTSPVGTTEKMAAWLAELRPDLTFPQANGEDSDIRIAYCPERVLPGHVIRELVENTRVIGGMTLKCSKSATELYKIFVEADCIVTNARTAEMAKLTENCFRDVNIAFANELSLICDKNDINVWELIDYANRHPRVNILQPGPGVGGHCIAVDPWFIIDQSPDQSKLIRAARQVNESKPDWVVEKVIEAAELIENPTIACLGLSFKPDIDDVRESPALEIVRRLFQKGLGKLLVCEPNIDTIPAELDGIAGVSFCSVEEAIDASDLVLILVKHKAFENLGLGLFQNKKVIDVCGFNKNKRFLDC